MTSATFWNIMLGKKRNFHSSRLAVRRLRDILPRWCIPLGACIYFSSSSLLFLLWKIALRLVSSSGGMASDHAPRVVWTLMNAKKVHSFTQREVGLGREIWILKTTGHKAIAVQDDVWWQFCGSLASLSVWEKEVGNFRLWLIYACVKGTHTLLRP